MLQLIEDKKILKSSERIDKTVGYGFFVLLRNIVKKIFNLYVRIILGMVKNVFLSK